MTSADITVEGGIVRLRPMTCRCHQAKAHSDMPSLGGQLSVFLASEHVGSELELDIMDPVSGLKKL